MAQIEAKSLWKEYGDNVVLEQVNVKVEKGEFITIVGTSGCGKSTFLRMLLGVEQASRGELLLDGKTFPTEPGDERGIVFQRYSVFPHLSVLKTRCWLQSSINPISWGNYLVKKSGMQRNMLKRYLNLLV